jgi:TetR/AcrR family transcriptional repressor of mexJK operon
LPDNALSVKKNCTDRYSAGREPAFGVKMNSLLEEPPRTLRDAKDRAIIEVAMRLFLERGYQSVPTELIAKEAGVSKSTLYAHYSGKDKLFEEIVTRQTTEFCARIDIPTIYSGDPQKSLETVALKLVWLFQEKKSTAMRRLLISEIRQFPELARRFEKMGPGKLRQRMTNFMQLMQAAGDVEIDDFELASEQLISLLIGALNFSLDLGLPLPPADVIEHQVRKSVQLFLRGYSPRTALNGS